MAQFASKETCIFTILGKLSFNLEENMWFATTRARLGSELNSYASCVHCICLESTRLIKPEHKCLNGIIQFDLPCILACANTYIFKMFYCKCRQHVKYLKRYVCILILAHISLFGSVIARPSTVLRVHYVLPAVNKVIL